ncbi:hypothetical protein D3C71_1286830 [compost metagenome]
MSLVLSAALINPLAEVVATAVDALAFHVTFSVSVTNLLLASCATLSGDKTGISFIVNEEPSVIKPFALNVIFGYVPAVTIFFKITLLFELVTSPDNSGIVVTVSAFAASITIQFGDTSVPILILTFAIYNHSFNF